MDILISIVAKVAEYTVAPIGRQLGYLFFYNRNIKDLENQLANLETTRKRVQNLVNEAKSDAYEIYDDVSTWLLAEVDVELPNMPQQYDEGGSNMEGSNPSCLSFVQRHKLSRKSKKKVKDILELIEKGKKFDKVGHPAPLPDTKNSTLPADYQILESRTLMAEKIKDVLADPNVNKVGACGMGGVGKTKLLDEVKKLVLENKLFDRVIDVTIGQSNGVIEIQDQIGGKLNMGLNMKAGSKEVRASFLRLKLVEMKENILIMLDDLWKEYDLEKEVGIPCRSELSKEGCKILMTSRSSDILTNDMNANECFHVNSLSEEESWKFFMAIVGEFDKNGIEHIARNVVKQCGGLPIALKIIAKALKGKEVGIWKDALEKLEKHFFVKIKGVNNKLYSCLKLSYDWIEDEEARLLFLLCSVFPDDHEICLKDLQMYAMGMGLLNDINNWEAAKNRVIELVEHLKSSSLLLESYLGDNYVKMHDVVRDVAKYIASNEDKMFSLSYTCGQSEWRENDRYEVSNLPPNLKFPKLQLLILILSTRSGNETTIPIPDAFFEGMKKLRVLDMTNIPVKQLWTSLTLSLKNLRTLCVSYCECNDIDTIGLLNKLEILRINRCTIQELPASMSKLTQLKVLDVSYCYELKVISPNIISSMTKLEELSLWQSFKKWGEEVSHTNELIKNVELSELDHLTRLSSLRLEIPKVDILLEDLSLERARKLEEFCICVGAERSGFKISDQISSSLVNWRKAVMGGSDGYARSLTINNIKSQIIVNGGAFQILLEACEKLQVRDSVGFTEHLFKPNANFCYPHLKHLHIHRSSDMPPPIDFQVQFPELKDLTIEVGSNLETLWRTNGLTSNSFCKLQNIVIRYCNGMSNLFSSSVAKDLVNLRKVEIWDCRRMTSIVAAEREEEKSEEIIFNKMIELTLHNLPRLASFHSGKCTLKFPCLEELRIRGCPEMNKFSNGIERRPQLEYMRTGEVEVHRDGNMNINNFFTEEIVFSNLRILEIKSWKAANCNRVMNLFSFVVAKSLVNLESITVFGCGGMTSIVAAVEEGEGEEENGEEIIFSKMTHLTLHNLPRLANFHSGKWPLKFPCLKELSIIGCPKMKTFSYGKISMPKLKYMSMEGEVPELVSRRY